MSEEIEKVYLPDPLSAYGFKDRMLIRTADIALYSLIRSVGMTVTFETEGWENLDEIEAAGRVPIYAFWHDRIFLATYFFRNRGIVVITSQSLDGEYIARFIRRFGFGAIRGSSTRGGTKALVEMIRGMRRGLPMGFTVDGPKGPRYVAKSGPVLLAKKTGNPIIPFIVEAAGYATITSWDRLQIPRPFTRANIIIGKPIFVGENAGDAEIEAKRAELQASLDDLVARGAQWKQRNTN